MSEAIFITMINDDKEFEEYQKSYVITSERVIYVSPSVVGLSDGDALLMCAYDARDVYNYKNHTYVRIEDLIEYCPNKKEFLSQLKSVILNSPAMNKIDFEGEKNEH
jgi:hypothetical protein